MSTTSLTKVAAVQAEPVWLDLQGGVDKVISIIQEAAQNGANVLGFPEVFIPGYPWSIWAHSPVDNAVQMNKYFQNSLVRESPEMDRIRTAVKEAGIFVVLAYSERFNSSLYIAQSYIDQTGTIVYHRRKTKPTHVERAYWGDGQADSLTNVVTTPFGKIGALNCWEHTQPLLRYHEYSQDVDIHVASWPCIFELPEGGVNWQYHISSEASSRFSQVMAMEGACFLLVCTQILTEKNRGKDRLENFPFAKAPGGGFSMIFGPDGRPLVEPLGAGVEGILYAEVDLEKKALAKQNVDVVGHYSRPDLLSLKVNLKPATQIQYG